MDQRKANKIVHLYNMVRTIVFILAVVAVVYGLLSAYGKL